MSDGVRLIEIKEEIQADNERVARELRDALRATRTFAFNLMSSPGAGKTSTIVRTVEMLRDRLRFGVLEADIDSSVDAELIAARGIPAVQLRTGGFCHLDAAMVTRGIEALDLGALDVVILENVGNLVCPAEFDTGANRNVMILSVPEGDDKALKYPLMFTVSDVLLVNKIDYMALSDFNLERLRERALRLNPGIRIFPVSARTGEGFEDWTQWLLGQANAFIAPGDEPPAPSLGRFLNAGRC